MLIRKLLVSCPYAGLFLLRPGVVSLCCRLFSTLGIRYALVIMAEKRSLGRLICSRTTSGHNKLLGPQRQTTTVFGHLVVVGVVDTSSVELGHLLVKRLRSTDKQAHWKLVVWSRVFDNSDLLLVRSIRYRLVSRGVV